jgi:hypothetical protein
MKRLFSTRREILVASALILLVLQLLFTVLLFLSGLVPVQSQISALEKAVASGDLTKNYPKTFGDTRLDGYTECLALTVNVDGGRYESNFDRIVSAPKLNGCKALNGWIENGSSELTDAAYYRYWNGHVILLPAFTYLGLNAVHLIVALGLIGSLVFAVIQISRGLGLWPASLLLLPLLVSTNFLFTPLATTQGLSGIMILFGGALAALFVRRFGWQGALVASLFAGSIYNFADLLTTPALAWALVAFVSAATGFVRYGYKESRNALVASLGGWMLGYGFTWLSRWILASTVWPWKSVAENISNQVGFRVSGEHEKVKAGVGSASLDNLTYWLGHSTLAAGIGFLSMTFFLIALVFVFRTRSKTLLISFFVILIPSILVIAWYELLSNHSQIHTFFTYRSTAIIFGIMIAASFLIIESARRQITPTKSD